MSASDPNSKIDLLEKPDAVKSKLKKAVCAPQEIEGNGVISFVEYVLFPCAQLAGRLSFHVPRPEKYGGPVDYASIDELKAAYADGSVCPPPRPSSSHLRYTPSFSQLTIHQLQPGDLKAGVELALGALLAPIQEDFNSSEEFKKISELAYPPPAVQKKPKKEKKIGTGYPAKDKRATGAGVAEAVADGKVKPEEAVAQAVGTGAENAIEKLKVAE